MSNCANHKKEVAGITDMHELAKQIGDLHYEALNQLLWHLSVKFGHDAQKDFANGRPQMYHALRDASKEIRHAQESVLEAWEISKPFMNK